MVLCNAFFFKAQMLELHIHVCSCMASPPYFGVWQTKGHINKFKKLTVILASGSNASTVWATTHKAKSILPGAKQSKGKNYILNLC